ncbi:MAG: Ni/Fe-hydrogenase cytochrome b subunit [Myxococcales bacterium]|nr:Ni/Fe-hydrogenase cytochrome b subunit [Myxococcales bacterium]
MYEIDYGPDPGLLKWQRGVHVYDQKIVTPAFILFGLLAFVGVGLSVIRLFGGLAFTGMHDTYAWGIWKTFNVMTLTALGSGGFAIGIAAWIFDWKRLHLVMRTALLTSLLFYWAGLVALGIDVGRPWNFYNIIFLTTWNGHSALLEVSVCMTAYAVVFLLFENIPPIYERAFISSPPERRKWLAKGLPIIKSIYPYMVAAAYILPMMHQSSLGALMLLAGPKLHPLWQTQFLPLLYVIQAGVAGTACVLFTLMAGCLYWRRPLDTRVLADLALLMIGCAFAFIGIRWLDILVRGDLPLALDFSDKLVWVFHAENALVLLPSLVLLSKRFRHSPRYLFKTSVAICLGAMMYRFVPTTISFVPGLQEAVGQYQIYFPSFAEVLMSMGYIALTVVGFSAAVKLFAIFPAPLGTWYEAVTAARASDIKVDIHGKASDD